MSVSGGLNSVTGLVAKPLVLWISEKGNGGYPIRFSLILPALGVALVPSRLARLYQAKLHRIGQQLRTNAPERFEGAQPALTVLAGGILRFLVTLTSVGAGALGIAVTLALVGSRILLQS